MADKKKIAKNTIALFFRMGLIMIISLYTSRVIIQQLGVSDFGTYNVVGGVVVMISFLISSLAQGIQRFINYYLGRKEEHQLNMVFTSGVAIMSSFAMVVFILGETVGLFVLNHYLNIPYERMPAANWVLQFSLFSVFASMLVVPFQGLILAHEDMKFYAYVSIIEAALKLSVAFALSISPIDKLVLYSLLLCITNYLILIFYNLFSKARYKECRFKWHNDKEIYKSLLKFSGWNVLGSSTSMLTVQGINIILNLFFSTIINAARGIAVQVSSLVDSTISNIQTAMNPQLTQLYAQEKYEEMKNLLFDNFKWNFYLYWLIALPLFLKIDYVLELWLGKGFVPEYTSIFIKITIIRCLLKCFERPLNTIIFATGDVKTVNLFSSSFYVIEILLAIVLFSLGFPPYWCFILDLLVVSSIVIYEMGFIHNKGIFSYSLFVIKVGVPLIVIMVISSILSYGVCKIPMSSILSLIFVCIASTIFSVLLIFGIGLSSSNRHLLVSRVKETLK